MSTTRQMIPFNRASLAGRELNYVAQAVQRGHISGNGSFTLHAESLLEEISGARKVLLTTSCTHALELAARLLGLGPGDEVIVPSFTFVSTASAFALTGARPVFVDVSDTTLNLDVSAVEASITPRTRAVVAVHYAGVAEKIDELRALCDRTGVALIEDNAHGLGGTFKGKPLGSFGLLSTLSFHETKNITCGEGGAITLNDASLQEAAEILREKGTNRARFLRGQVDKYTWVDIGSSWVPSDMLAAFLVAQLEDLKRIQAVRMHVWQRYHAELRAWTDDLGIRQPYVPEGAQHPAHMYFLRMPDLATRTRFIEHMMNQQVMTVFHYQALNASPVGVELGGSPGQAPIAEMAAETLVRLPLFASLNDAEVNRVVESAKDFRG